MAARPYNDPANVKPNGQPKMSENAWAIYEQLREDMAEDTSWGTSLASAIEKTASKKDLIDAVSAFDHFVTKKDFNAHISSFGNNTEVLLAINAVSAKLDSVRAALLATCQKIDSDAIPGADTNYKASAEALLT